MNKNDSLAWYIYPVPNGRSYSEEELKSPKIVEEVFDYCQILLASISAKGWEFLVEQHGIENLLKINESSGWFSNDSFEEARANLIYQCHLSGYDPISDSFGNYDEERGFVPFE